MTETGEQAPTLAERLRQAADAVSPFSPAFHRIMDGVEEIKRLTLALAASDAARVQAEGRHATTHAPSLERIKRAHSAMPLSLWASDETAQHRTYYQGDNEQCYLCALVILLEAAEAERDSLRKQLERADAVELTDLRALAAVFPSYYEAVQRKRAERDAARKRAEEGGAREALAASPTPGTPLQNPRSPVAQTENK